LKTSEYRHIGGRGSKIAQKNRHMIFKFFPKHKKNTETCNNSVTVPAPLPRGGSKWWNKFPEGSNHLVAPSIVWEIYRWKGGQNLGLEEYAIRMWGPDEQEPVRYMERSVSQRSGGIGCALCISGSRASSWKEEIQLNAGSVRKDVDCGVPGGVMGVKIS